MNTITSFQDRIHSITQTVIDTYSAGKEAILQQALVLAEETGESVKEVRRYLGFARSTSTCGKVGEELADVIIAAAVTADMLNIDLDEAIARKLHVIEQRGGK